MTNFATGEQYVNSKDGTTIYVKSYSVENPKAQLLVVHGFLEHCLRYDEFAQEMTKRQLNVTLFDYRGHGRSGGDRAYLDDWDNYTQDLITAFDTMPTNSKIPTFVLGHSNGGAIVLNYLLDNPSTDIFKGVLLSSPFLAPADDLGWFAKTIAKFVGSYIPTLKLPANLQVEKLTSDKDKQKQHSEDEMNLSEITAGWAYQGIAIQDKISKQVLEENIQIQLPLFFAYSTKDKVADPTKNQQIAEHLNVTDKTILPQDGEHEILNEVNREKLYDAVSKWILSKKA